MAKFIFVWIKFKMQPFTIGELIVLVIAAIAYALAYIIPGTGLALLDIIIHSGTFSLLFGVAILYFNIAPDLTKFFNQIVKRLKTFF